MQKRNSAAQTSSVGLTFYHNDGLVAAYKQAAMYAGRTGRLATMPDIIDCRLSSELGEIPWETYFTTTSAEYSGYSKAGNEILIVAHGIGPMATLDGIMKAYSFQFKDKNRNSRGGRITRKEFLDLESGKYGEVSIVDIGNYLKLYKYPFIQKLRASQAAKDPVVKARFGSKAEAYALLHAERALIWHSQQLGKRSGPASLPSNAGYEGRMQHMHSLMSQPGSDPFILEIESPSDCYYPLLEKILKTRDHAAAHLLSIGCLMHCSHHDDYGQYISLSFSCSGHGWNDGVRFLATKGQHISGVVQGADNIRKLLADNWRTLLRDSGRTDSEGLFALMEFGGEWFTQYPKKGESLDSHEPEFLIIKKKKIGEPTSFRTEIGGYHMFFRYGLNKVKQLARVGANAYEIVGDPWIESVDGSPKYHWANIQFYSAEIGYEKRLLRCCELQADYDLMMSLVSSK